MKNIVFVGINSRFNHVNLAVRSIDAYIKSNSKFYSNDYQLILKNFTISEPLIKILRGIILEKPDLIIFSTYIWNSLLVFEVIDEIKKILPNCLVGVGGPEVSFDCETILKQRQSLDFIVSGEGELTDMEVCDSISQIKEDGSEFKKIATEKLSEIKGVWSRQYNSSIAFGGIRDVFDSLDKLIFPYSDQDGNLLLDISPDYSIIYYESSRGCPFKCSYCLSSVDKTVRFMSLEKVYEHLAFFMKNNVKLVKFVDRTFNLNEERYTSIWNFIKNHWNGKTTFHFEIAVEYLSEKALDLIKDVPYGMMQFEIGIQTTNKETLKAIGRNSDFSKISKILAKIPKTIHVHLDLIAGLPFESPKEFKDSFNYTILQRPQMLQFGFLKILHGTLMEQFANKYEDYKWLSVPPYEVLQSPWVTYSQMQHFKDLDEVIDSFYNSQNFSVTMNYLLNLADDNKIDMFSFFEDFALYYKTKKYSGLPHKVSSLFEYFYDFINNAEVDTMHYKSGLGSLLPEEYLVIKELLRFDFIRREKPGTYPSWYIRYYDKDSHRNALEKFTNIRSTRESFTYSAYEEFYINPLESRPVWSNNREKLLILYKKTLSLGVLSKTHLRFEESECILYKD